MKKIISLVVIMALCFTFPIVSQTEDSSLKPLAQNHMEIYTSRDQMFSDVKDTEYENEINFLASLGFFEDYRHGKFEPKQTITRSVMAVCVTNMMGLAAEYSYDSSHPTPFEDVPANYWTSDFINMAVSTGLMSGIEGKFEPEREVKYMEAVKIVVSALGYELAAKDKGGYPNGYLAVASDLGLLKPLGDYSAEASITREHAAALIYKALNTEVLEQTVFGGVNTFTTTENVTLLYRKSKIYKGRGQITENEITSLKGETTVSENQVKIGDCVFQIGTTNADDLLGLWAEFYYTEENDIRTLKYIEMKASKNEIKVIEAEQLLSYQSYTYEYELDETRSRRISINSKTDILYNGKPATRYDDDIMVPQNGFLEFISINGESVVSVLKIYAYEDFPVQDVDLYEEIAYRQNDGSGSIEMLDLSEDTNKYIKIRDLSGNLVNASEVKSGDTLSVIISEDQSYIDVYVSRDTVNGTVDGLTDGTKKMVTINGVEYPLSPCLNANIELGDIALAYLNVNGEIAYYEKTQTASSQYGIMQAVGKNDEAFAEGVKLKIFHSQGSTGVFTVYELAEKTELTCTVGGQAYTVTKSFEEPAEFLEYVPTGKLFQMSGEKEGIVQLILYRTNSRNEITEIEFSFSNLSDTEKYTSGEEADNSVRVRKLFQTSTGTGYWEREPLMFNYIPAKLNEKAVVFIIPTDLQDTEHYSLRNHWYFTSKTDYAYTSGYNHSLDEISADAVVTPMREGADAIPYYNTTVSVQRMTVAVDEDGNAAEKLYVFSGGVTTSYLISDNVRKTKLQNGVVSTVPDLVLESGDIILFTTNADGRISAIRQMYDYSAQEHLGTGNFAKGGNAYLSGYVFDIRDSMLIMTKDSSLDGMQSLYDNGIPSSALTTLNFPVISASTKFTVISTNGSNIVSRAGNRTNLITYRSGKENADRVFVEASYGKAHQIYIFK